MKIQLFHKKAINSFLLGAFGIPLGVFVFNYFSVSKDPDVDLAAINWLVGPTIIFMVFMLPFFKFKTAEKVNQEEALIKIPIIEIFPWAFMGIGAFMVFCGAIEYLDNEPNQMTSSLILGSITFLFFLCVLNSNTVLFWGDYLTQKEITIREKRKTSYGLFVYNDVGFSYTEKSGEFSTSWMEIETIVAYKTDNFSYDTIRLVIKKTNGLEILISEDTEGWVIFMEKMNENLLGLDQTWLLKVMFPPFDQNLVKVYQKGEDFGEETPH